VLNRWTVDVESCWGGRDNSVRGIEIGVPQILEEFKKYNIKAIFFLSTRKLIHYLPYARMIIRDGHTIGSHGHEHINWKRIPWIWTWIDWCEDYETSKKLLKEYLDVDIDLSLYRAPWFSVQMPQFPLSCKKNHVSVLKHSWFKGRIPKNPIFYIHPFDIVKAPKIAPNMFCKALYSRPEKVRETFHELVQKFS